MSVKTIAYQFSQTRGEAGLLHTRAIDFCMLMKPRVMVLAVFTAFVGLVIAPVDLHPLNAFVAVLAIAAGAGAAAVLNMWYDADIDAVMARTAKRPIPRGKVLPIEALVFGIVLAMAAIAVLALATNVAAGTLLALAILFYVIVYTAWLKRLTPQNIVIGGAAGALPPVIGWAAATGQIGIEPLVLFLIIFLWTPPHFWALALNRTDEYAGAGVPMLPVVAGRAATTRQILIYCALLSAASVLPWALGFAGPIYAAAAIGCGAKLVVLAIQLRISDEADRRAPRRLFAFSIFYLFVLFAAVLIDHADQPQRSTPVFSSRTVHAEALPNAARAAGISITTGTDEV
ncbi:MULTISPECIES: heme o synthase [unclassified Mesorhizobium]|uniref:heme o synthase n=1 Tax=unclassified Mesorhizobium TaxID=325217 RepID=UPI00333BB51D